MPNSVSEHGVYPYQNLFQAPTQPSNFSPRKVTLLSAKSTKTLGNL